MKQCLVIGLALVTLAACETAKGAGQDLENAGDAISDTAEEVQDDL
ncbi:entericidin A/B family lipoprotein [Shimia aestuarii]|nr:entericidin A/B family lipoprotein [Shimia aestuarii]